MKRREFLALSAATTLLPMMATAGVDTIKFVPGVVEDLLSEGKTVFVLFYADWCSTCRAQDRRVNALRAEDPVYDENLEFVKVDWDTYSQSEIASWYAITARSTLLVVQEDAEIGRNHNGTSRKVVKALMDAGVAAAQSKGA